MNRLQSSYYEIVRRRNAVVLMLGAAVLICIAFVYAFRSSPPSTKLPDGTTLHLTGAKVGFTNQFQHGNRIEKLLGNLIPTNGGSIGNWKLQPPDRQQFGWSTNATTLTLQLKLTGESNHLAQSELFNRPPFYRKFRFVHWGNDGFRYTEEIPERYFSKRRDGYFGYINTTTFARSSDMLHLEVHQRDVHGGEWRSIARFDFKNPHPTAVATWSTSDFPVTNEYDGFTAVLGTIQIQQPRDHATRYRDIWQHHVSVPFQFFRDGRPVTNWNAEQISVYDATGNEHFLGASTIHTNGWILKRGFRSANPFVPWKFTGHFAQESGFASTNLISFDVPLSLAGAFTTNIGSIDLRIDLRNGNMLFVRLDSQPHDRRLTLVDIVNESGKSVKEHTGSRGQHQLLKAFNRSEAKSRIRATVAIVRDIGFVFNVQPKLVESISPPPAFEGEAANPPLQQQVGP